MKIFVSGASGLVGGNCLSYFKGKTDMEIIGSYFSYSTKETVYFNTLDLENSKNFDVIKFQPDVIIHCGALTHVDYCEKNESESYEKTVLSTQNLISICKKVGAKLVYISTDYIFDGTQGPYNEDDTPNPLNVYGRHKLEAEEMVKNEMKNKFLNLRITNVYGDEERGKNFVSRMIQNALSKKEIRFALPYDQYATPINAADIAKALYLLIKDNKTGTYNIASTDFVNRIQLSELILKYYPEHKVKIDKVLTRSLGQDAKRPLTGGLISQKFLNEYPSFKFSNIDDYLKLKTK